MRTLFGLIMLGISCVAYSQTSQQPFSITISTDKPEVKAGDPVYLDVTMTNTSGHDVDCAIFSMNHALDGNYQYDVVDEDGAPVPKIEKKSNVSSAYPCIIKPGETSKSGGTLNVLYDFHRPGKYTVQVSRPIWGDDQRPGTGGTVQNNQPVVKSNTITVTVVASEPPADQPQ
jgi:hypothetical protein